MALAKSIINWATDDSLYWAFSDIFAMTWRNLIRYVRLPQLLIFSTIQPVMFVILFAYVFGGAISTPGFQFKYVDYLIPGIIVQTVIFGSVQAGVGLAEDMTKGLIDRFRSLPMARAAVLAGRTLADTIRNIFVVGLMVIVGFLIGFRFHGSPVEAILGLTMAVLLGFSFSWIGATIGLLVKEAETAQVAGFIWIFPLVFASSAFVPISTMPDWLQEFAKINPITLTVNTVRGFSLGQPLTGDFLKASLAIALILIIFAPLSVFTYRKRS